MGPSIASLKEMIQKAVTDLMSRNGNKDVYHSELGWVVKEGKATHALIAFFKKMERKRAKKSSN